MKWYIAVLLILLAALLLDAGLLAYSMYVLLGLLLLTRYPRPLLDQPPVRLPRLHAAQVGLRRRRQG